MSDVSIVNANPLSTESELFALQDLLRSISAQISVCMPAIVQEYDRVSNTVKVRPAVKYIRNDGITESRQIITMPVVRFGSTFTVSFSLKQGDLGLIFFADRDCYNFLKTLAEADPNTRRVHAVEDGFFLPFNLSTADNTTADVSIQNADGTVKVEMTTENLTLTNGESTLVFNANGASVSKNVSVAGNTESATYSTGGVSGLTTQIVEIHDVSGATKQTLTFTNGLLTNVS